MDTNKNYPQVVQFWLWIGVVMVFGQVVLGGITRLTDSGLSMTDWNLIMGVFPPSGESAWQIAFESYKERAKTQYEAIHSDMVLNEFKWIFFWEYFHRLWARIMGLVFLFPFIFFLWKKWIDRVLVKRLLIVILIAALAAVFGWIMVKSGLDTPDRAWVSAYKLMVHLGIGFSLFAYLLWTTFHTKRIKEAVTNIATIKRSVIILFILVFVQVLLGGLMSGMKAGMVAPTWPSINGAVVPSIIFDTAAWNSENFLLYNNNTFVTLLVQVLHRFVAYGLSLYILWFVVRANKLQLSSMFKKGMHVMVVLLVVQVLLGIFTLINCVGGIPVTLGVLHQAGGLCLLGVLVYLLSLLSRSEGGYFDVENNVDKVKGSSL